MVWAQSVNDSGVIVGNARTGTSSRTALRWAPGGRVSTLPPLPGDLRASTEVVISNGTVFGYSHDNSDRRRAVRWSPSGTVALLQLKPGDISSSFTSVSDGRVVVGRAGGTDSQGGWVTRSVR
ncbi:hypothetical protein AB0I60_02775 [Actinosynnema sp. NPDC050436]|uniref:hypothetical protein n=1 Tax=Actinosynnema sp. NPDC050436 TaxID=3155659 RepID=UPI0033F6E5ED